MKQLQKRIQENFTKIKDFLLLHFIADLDDNNVISRMEQKRGIDRRASVEALAYIHASHEGVYIVRAF
jgi:hypothetical protein